MTKGEVIEVENGLEWKIKDFFSAPVVSYTYSNEYQDSFTSPTVSYNGSSWKFHMYRNGNGPSRGYIDVCLYRENDYPPIIADIVLSIKTISGVKEVKSHCTTAFDYYQAQYEFSRLISRFDLIKRKTELVPSDVLTIVCTFNFPKSTGSASGAAAKTCSYCKEIFHAESISLHKKKCMCRPIKCPYCSNVVLLENWYDHECQKNKLIGGSNASGSSLVHHHHKILQDLKQLLLEQKHCDVILRVKKQEFHAHKAILIARSLVLASTFGNDMKEKESGIVNIEDCDPSIFKEFLFFLYTDDVENISKENVFGLFTMADKYNVPDLKTRCLEFLKNNLSVEIFCETITLALLHSQTELINFATDYFVKNAPKIIMTTKWQSFVNENPTQGNELFIKFATFDQNSNV